jgi:hypothetical protein
MCTIAFGSTCPAKESEELVTEFGRIVLGDWCGCGEFVNTVLCGPELTAGGCCYVVDVGVSTCEGRPMLVRSSAIVASIRRGKQWCTSLGVDTLVDATTPEHRAALAVAWTDSALAEHGSIASFARASLELLALGAPAALLREIHEAMGDEIAHAELCFSLATELGGAPVGPGALPLPGTLALRTTPIDCAVATVVEGCINETLCALVAQAQHDAATAPRVGAALLRIAEDEARHAALAWKTVAWLIREHGAPVREAVRQAFARGPALDLEGSPIEARVPPDVARAWGRLPASEVRALIACGMASVVAPAARVLLSTNPTARREGETTATL